MAEGSVATSRLSVAVEMSHKLTGRCAGGHIRYQFFVKPIFDGTS
jgi:hypothetical protein